MPVTYGSDIWLVDTQTWFFVGSGTALDASNKWVGVLTKAPAGTVLQTLTIDSGALNTHRQSTKAAIGALLGTTNFELAQTGQDGHAVGHLHVVHGDLPLRRHLTYRYTQA